MDSTNKNFCSWVFTGLFFLTALTTATSGASADNRIFNINQPMCPVTRLQICGMPYFAPAGNLGALETFSLPDKFQTGSVAVQCVSEGGLLPYYKFIGDDVNCALKFCSPTTIPLCGSDIPVDESAQLGDVVEARVSPLLLTNSHASAPPVITARCGLANGIPKYHLESDNGLSCNDFLCRPLTLNICNSSVTISTASELGMVLTAKTTTNQPVSVQCLGSSDAPHYVIMDNPCN